MGIEMGIDSVYIFLGSMSDCVDRDKTECEVFLYMGQALFLVPVPKLISQKNILKNVSNPISITSMGKRTKRYIRIILLLHVDL